MVVEIDGHHGSEDFYLLEITVCVFDHEGWTFEKALGKTRVTAPFYDIACQLEIAVEWNAVTFSLLDKEKDFVLDLADQVPPEREQMPLKWYGTGRC